MNIYIEEYGSTIVMNTIWTGVLAGFLTLLQQIASGQLGNIIL